MLRYESFQFLCLHKRVKNPLNRLILIHTGNPSRYTTFKREKMTKTTLFVSQLALWFMPYIFYVALKLCLKGFWVWENLLWHPLDD